MLLTHAKLRENVLRLDDTEIDALLLYPVSEWRVGSLTKYLKELDKVTKMLQQKDVIVLVARAYIDTMLERYPTLTNCLDSDAHIVLSPLFQLQLLEIQNTLDLGL